MIAECDFQLEALKQGKDSERLPSNANIFYELYLKDDDDKLAIVPVVVRNYRDAEENLPNAEGTDMTSWVLTRRFFVYDSLSGIQGGSGSSYRNGLKPDYVRWAGSLQLKVELSTDSQGQILRPYIVVDYSEADVTTIDEQSVAPAKFVVEYYSDYVSVLRTFFVTFAAFVILSFLWAIVRFYYYTVRNPMAQFALDSRTAYLKKLFYYIFDCCGDMIYVLMLLFCAITMLNYKR